METDFSISENIEEDTNLELVVHTNKTIVYSMYLKLNQFEHHFDIITTKYKYMALSWILGTYAAIGFMLSKEVENLSFNPFISVIIACIIGIIGISLIWHLDINIYTKFWAVAFIEEIRMERKFKFLLRSRNLELLIDNDRARIISQGFLYIIANSFLIITMSFAIIYIIEFNNKFYSVILGALCIAFNFFICFVMHKIASKTQRTFIEIIKKI